MKSIKRLACACALASTVMPAFAEEVTLSFSSFVGERNPIFQCSMIPFVDTLEANGGTSVTVERYFGGGAFGSPKAQYDQAARGITDLSFGVLTYNAGLHPLSEIISMPFMMEDHEAATRVLNETILPEYLQDELGDVKVIALFLTSPYQLHMTREVEDLTDLDGLRVRTSGTAHVASLDALGAQVASFPAPQTYENLQKGVIDGTLATWTTATAFKVGEVATRHYEVNSGASVGFTIMNLDTYNGLPEDVKAIVDGFAGMPASMKVAGCFAETDRKAKEKWTGVGNTAIPVSADIRAAMAAKVQPIVDAHLKSLADRGLPAFEIRDRIVAELEKSGS